MITNFEQLGQALMAGQTDFRDSGQVYIRQKGSLTLFKYLPTATFKPNREWTWLERQARGLIMNHVTGEIVARPFSKFFNWPEEEATSDSGIHMVFDKLDGSLGIIYYNPDLGDIDIVTNGSFDSDQANDGRQLLKSLSADGYNTLSEAVFYGKTVLVEIIIPGNAPVVQYGARHELVYLNMRDNRSGRYEWMDLHHEIASSFGMTPAEVYYVGDMTELKNSLENTKGTESEGFVVFFNDGVIAKVKGPDYLRLHRIVSDISPRRIFEQWASGDVENTKSLIPNEFHAEFDQVVAEIEDKIKILRNRAELLYNQLLGQQLGSRKDQAVWITNNVQEADRGLVFALLSGKDIQPILIKILKEDY